MTASIPATLPLAARKARQGARRHRREAHPAAARRAELAGGRRAQRERHQLLGHRRAGRARRAAVVARLNADVQKVLAQPDVRERLEREGAELIPGRPSAWAR